MKKLGIKQKLGTFFKKAGFLVFVGIFSYLIFPANTYASNTLVNQSQDLVITGTVSDATGPLPGVNVMVKGQAGVGAVTDFDGNYSIEVSDENAILAFSYIGFETQEVPVNGNNIINVTLEASASNLSEVVVLGYTSRKRGELTGSVSTVDSETMENTANKDLEKSLAGRVPGLIVSDRGGYPGSTGDVNLLIRGKSTLGNNSPLILIDGITAGSFSHLSPQDIESVSVLKDGAAAIYGARAANGVILITTKRGKQGKPRITLNSVYSISQFSVTPDLMTSEEYAIYNNEIAERNGTPLPYTQEQINNYAAGTYPIRFPNTDWADLTFADFSPESRTSLSISGGSENVNYFVSGDYLDQVGIFHSGDLNFNQYQIRSNVDINVIENLKIGVDLNGRFGERNEPGVDDGYIYKHIYTNEPTEVGVYPNGLVAWGGENGSNPYIMSTNDSGFVTQYDNDLRGKFSFDLNLDWLVEGLRAKGFAGVRKMSNDQKSWYTPWTVYTFQEGTNDYVPSQGFSQRGNERILRESFWKFNELMLNATVHYETQIKDTHNISGFVGIEQFSSNQRNFWAERRGFPSDNHPELFAGSDEGQQSFGTSQEWARLNYFGSLSYDYDKKYFVDLTLRHDGSSNFGPGKRFGTFPGIAASWVLTKENFLEDRVSWLNSLKLRASWAKMGNDRIAPFQYLTRYEYGGPTNTAQPNYYIFGAPGVAYNGYTSANVPNPDITWETSYMKNIGLSFELLDSRLRGDINYFYQNREDILVTRAAAIPDMVGITLPAENIGKVDNFGWEFQLDWNDVLGEEFKYNLGANFTQAKNEVVYLAEAADVPDYRKREGHPLDSYIVYPTDGIFNNQAEVEAAEATLDGTVEGEPHYLDTDGNGIINANDRIRKYSSNVPEIQYGVFGGFNFKNFNFNFLFQGQANAEMLVFFDQGGSRPDFIYNQRWTPENRDARYPRAFAQGDPYSGNQTNNVNNHQSADLWLRDASFLRLKEVELGYRFSKETLGFGDLRIFVRGFNVLTMFSDVYDLGLDPEAESYNNFRDSTYPSLKTYSVGLNFNF